MLQDQVEPGPVEDVDEVLQRELGAPASQLFAEFDPEARAAASLAQVASAYTQNSCQCHSLIHVQFAASVPMECASRCSHLLLL